MKKFFLSLFGIGICLLALQVQALTIDFSHQVPTDGSGKTSAYGVSADNVALSGYFIETFDQPGTTARTVQAIGGSIKIAAGAGFNTLDPEKLIVTGGGMGITSGSTPNVAAAPAGDTTHYAFGPGHGTNTSNATVKIENTAFTAYQPGLFIQYLGFYIGSVDTYNSIAFYSGDGLLKTESGFLIDGILSGSEILAAMHGISGNQLDDRSNVYVNLFFDNDELFTAFEFRTTGIAFEVDNVVTRVGLDQVPYQSPAPVPEPSTFLLLGGGLVALGFISRRCRKA
ncbi:MAG: PEP-CTERM sorting domain-containing protein [Desulfuromonas sp.]|nr:PEP-CTERM sorting domain-containing protein [Desulfuromonas sp.]